MFLVGRWKRKEEAGLISFDKNRKELRKGGKWGVNGPKESGWLIVMEMIAVGEETKDDHYQPIPTIPLLSNLIALIITF